VGTPRLVATSTSFKLWPTSWGDSLRIDEQALAKGALILEFDWPVDAQAVPLRAAYPDCYPRLRPIVQLRADPASFPKRHCNPTTARCACSPIGSARDEPTGPAAAPPTAAVLGRQRRR
jgi:hypothetical protein